MRAVWSSEQLTKRRPSGISARERTTPVWCVKLRRTVPSLTLKSLMAPAALGVALLFAAVAIGRRPRPAALL